MDNKSYGQFIIVQDSIEENKQDIKSNKKDSDEKIMKLAEDFKVILTSPITSITDQINTFKPLPIHKYSPKPPDPTDVVPSNKRALPLDGGQSTKIGSMWNLKHEISSPKFYKLLIKT